MTLGDALLYELKLRIAFTRLECSYAKNKTFTNDQFAEYLTLNRVLEENKHIWNDVYQRAGSHVEVNFACEPDVYNGSGSSRLNKRIVYKGERIESVPNVMYSYVFNNISNKAQRSYSIQSRVTNKIIDEDDYSINETQLKLIEDLINDPII